MKHYAIDMKNPALVEIARWATRRGQKLAALTKCAVDSATMSYWSDYFKQYGDMFVRNLALKKPGKTAQQLSEVDEQVKALQAKHPDWSTKDAVAFILNRAQRYTPEFDYLAQWYEQLHFEKDADYGVEDEEWLKTQLEKEKAKGKKGQLIPQGSTLDVKGEKLKVNQVTEAGGTYFYSLTKPDGSDIEMTDQQLQELDATLEQKVASLHKQAAQVVYDVAIKADVQPWVTLMPDAFEHALKFALEAIKPADAIHTSVDHMFADVESPGQMDPCMVGYAKCSVTFPNDESVSEQFKATVVSQLAKFLEDADFPCSHIAVESIQKRGPKAASIIEAARAGWTLARLTSHFGLHAARLARRCAEAEAEGMAHNPVYFALARSAQAELEHLEFSGDAASSAGAVAKTDSATVKILYRGKVEDHEFQWCVYGADGAREIAKGGADSWDEAVKDARGHIPQAHAAAAQELTALKLAFCKEIGPVASFEKVASTGNFREYRVALKDSRTAWVSMSGDKIVDKVFL